MSTYRGRTEFRLGVGFVIFYSILAILLAAGAVFMQRRDGWSWVAITLTGMALLSAGAILETLVLRIRLTEDTLIVRDLRGRRTYAKRDIERIEEAKGTPPALLLRDGRWARLPSLAGNLGNSVRAWLKASP